LFLVAVLGGSLVVDVLAARPAAAHATVVETTPADGARLDTAPAEVSVSFTEGVSLGAGYLRVLDADGTRVDTGAAAVRDRVVSVALRSGLPEAGYVVTYRVVSADSHPISGAWSFVIGDGALPAPGSVGDGGAGDSGSAAVGAAQPAVRWLGYLGLALGLGVPVFLITCWRDGWAEPRMRALTGAGLAAVGVSALLGVLLQGPYAGGAGLGSVLDPQLLSATVGSGYGRLLLVRALLALALAAVLVPVWRRGRQPGPALLVPAGLLAAGLVLTVAATGHPVAGSAPVLAVTVTAVHVSAMSGWLGGLVALLAAALPRGGAATDLGGELRTALARWSRTAFGFVVALVLSGVVQALREVGSLGALVHTTYGWLLVAKLAVVLLVLAAAAVSRDWVHQRLTGRAAVRRQVPEHAVAAGHAVAGHGATAGLPAARAPMPAGPADPTGPAENAPPAGGGRGGPDEVGLFRRSVLLELAGAAVVLALSAVLVGTPPARASVAAPVEVTLPLQSSSGTAGNGSVLVTLAPATPGPTTLHVYLYDEAGELTQPRTVAVTLTEPAQQIGPLDVALEPAGPGHYVGAGTALPTAGTWTLTVTTRLDEFTAVTAGTTFPVR
jgi:copper transport protein